MISKHHLWIIIIYWHYLLSAMSLRILGFEFYRNTCGKYHLTNVSPWWVCNSSNSAHGHVHGISIIHTLNALKQSQVAPAISLLFSA